MDGSSERPIRSATDSGKVLVVARVLQNSRRNFHRSVQNNDVCDVVDIGGSIG